MPKELSLSQGEENLVHQTIEFGRQVYDERVKVQKHIRRVRALRIDTRTPRTFQKLIGRGVRNPLPYALVQTINGLVAKGQPQFYREPLEGRSREDAAELARTCWPLIQTFEKLSRQKFSFYKIVDGLAGDGMSVQKLRRVGLKDYPVWDEESEDSMDFNTRVATFLAKGSTGSNPFRWSPVSPLVFWPDMEEEPRFVVESGRRALAPVLNDMGLEATKMGKLMPMGTTYSDDLLPSGLQSTTDVSEIWTEDYCYLVVGGKVFKYENEFGFIPYAWRYGMTTSIEDPALEAMSVVFPFYALDPYINTLLTSIVTNAIMHGMPTAVVTSDPVPGQPPQAQQGNTDIPLGQMVNLPVGKKFGYAAPPATTRDIGAAIELFFGLYDTAGVSSSVRGNIGTRTPGLTFASAIEAATDPYSPLINSAAGMLEDICRMTWMAIEKFNLPIQVTGHELIPGKGKKISTYKITPRMIGGYHDLTCTLQPMSDQQMTARGMHAAFMRDKQLWSTDRAMRYAGVENTEGERREILADFIRHSPVYMSMMMQRATEELPDVSGEMANQIAQGGDPLGLMGGAEAGAGNGQIRGAAPRGGGSAAGTPGELAGGPGNGGTGERFPK